MYLGVTILTFVGASLLNFHLIRRIYDCHAEWGYWMLCFAAGFYVKKVIGASYIAISDRRENQGDGDTAAIVALEVENQGAAIESENQANGDTTTTVTAATEAENQGNEDTATATTATAATEAENQGNGDTTTTASAATEGEENQGDEHTATAT